MGLFNAFFLIATSVWFLSASARSFFKGQDKSEGDRLEVNFAFATSSFVTIFIWDAQPSAVLIFQTAGPQSEGHMIVLAGVITLSISAVLFHRALTGDIYRIEKSKTKTSRRWGELAFMLSLTIIGLLLYGMGALDTSLSQSELRLIRRANTGSFLSFIVPWATLLLTCLWWSSRAYYFAPFEKLDNNQRHMRHLKSIMGQPTNEFDLGVGAPRIPLSYMLLLSPLLVGVVVNASSVGRVGIVSVFVVTAILALWGSTQPSPKRLLENPADFAKLERRFIRVTDLLAMFALAGLFLILVLRGTS